MFILYLLQMQFLETSLLYSQYSDWPNGTLLFQIARRFFRNNKIYIDWMRLGILISVMYDNHEIDFVSKTRKRSNWWINLWKVFLENSVNFMVFIKILLRTLLEKIFKNIGSVRKSVSECQEISIRRRSQRVGPEGNTT